ncbi:MAG TPA: hypothetical protein VFN20_00735 [Candidatus Acidoferrum sp.]|nr:hypothetical protein [Candidatus Acidoferrum sp.]
MATPASRLSATITPSQTVTITVQNGVPTPSQDPVTIPYGGSVQFVNNVAGQDYALQLFTNDNQKHVVAEVYLAAGGGSAILVSDSDSSSKGKKCFYNIEAYPPDATDKGGVTATTSGGHSIIIGSTPDDDK